MLLDSDIEFIKQSRKEVIHNRTTDLILHKRKEVEGDTDPFTGDPIYEIVVSEEPVTATWRPYFSQSPGTDDRTIVGGVVAEVGDAFAEFDLAVDLLGVEMVTHVDSGEEWIIRGVDVLGLGGPNRYYVLLGRKH